MPVDQHGVVNVAVTVPRAFAALFDARKGGDASKRRSWRPVVNVTSIAGEPFQFVTSVNDVQFGVCEHVNPRLTSDAVVNGSVITVALNASGVLVRRCDRVCSASPLCASSGST